MQTQKEFWLNRIVAPAVFLICLSIVLLIPFKIVSFGFLPPDDALRHAAKVISGKTWDKILVLKPEIKMDSHPGWHAILSGFQKLTNSNADTLVVFSVISMFLLFCLIPFLFLKRHEAWIITLTVFFLFGTQIAMRLFLGRPYIFTMAALIFILFSWQRLKEKELPVGLFVIITLLIAASTWIHCLWYLYPFLIFAFLLAREWRVSAILSISSIAGIILGAVLTGNPIQFFIQTTAHAVNSLSGAPLTRILATEFLPSGGDVIVIAAVLFLLIFIMLRGNWNIKKIDNPIFILAVCGWIFGLLNQRFWLDWGFPALLVWMSKEFEELLTIKIDRDSLKRLFIAGACVLTLYFTIIADTENRWTYNLMIQYLSLDNPAHKKWLPEEGGILYAADMKVFYQTFYKNPKANWRYILGFEPTMMPDQDLKIYRNIHWNLGSPESYRPWIKKMKPQDRLVIKNPSVKLSEALPELEWHHITGPLWIGRLHKNN